LSLPLRIDTIAVRQGPGCDPERVAANRRGFEGGDVVEGIFLLLIFTGLAFVYTLVFPKRKDESERETR
jgi:hypothetical protein